MFDLSDLIGKYKICISTSHKDLIKYVKDFPYLVYDTKKKSFLLGDEMPFKNFSFTYKDIECYISLVFYIEKHQTTSACFIHGDNLEVLKEFAILIDDEDDDKIDGLYN